MTGTFSNNENLTLLHQGLIRPSIHVIFMKEHPTAIDVEFVVDHACLMTISPAKVSNRIHLLRSGGERSCQKQMEIRVNVRRDSEHMSKGAEDTFPVLVSD